MRPVVKSTKHIVQFPIDQIATGTLQTVTLASAVALQDANASSEIVEGSIIKAIFIELWLHNQSNLAEQIVTVQKGQSGDFGPTFAEQAALFTYNNKKNVLFTHQGLSSNDGVGNPVAILRNWIKIPKSKQRFGLADNLTLSISNVSANDLNRCGMAIYKEYS